MRYSPYITFHSEDWASLGGNMPLRLSVEELMELKGLNDQVSLVEVANIYLPLARLLHLYVRASQNLYEVTHLFLGDVATKVPYIIGIAGSVAVGKSTTARIIQALLMRGPSPLKVDLVTTDGFLYPNRILGARGLMDRKGFPESYDMRALIKFLSDVKSGRPRVVAPLYSHLVYDILMDNKVVVQSPDVVILEGLNVLQSARPSSSSQEAQVFVSDFFDFSIYVDAAEENVRKWYIERFQTLRKTAFRNPSSYFHRYADLSVSESEKVAGDIWDRINGVNLRQNILPTRGRADLVLCKGTDHAVQEVQLRKL